MVMTVDWKTSPASCRATRLEVARQRKWGEIVKERSTRRMGVTPSFHQACGRKLGGRFAPFRTSPQQVAPAQPALGKRNANRSPLMSSVLVSPDRSSEGASPPSEPPPKAGCAGAAGARKTERQSLTADVERTRFPRQKLGGGFAPFRISPQSRLRRRSRRSENGTPIAHR